jgi:hypothetical protein
MISHVQFQKYKLSKYPAYTYAKIIKMHVEIDDNGHISRYADFEFGTNGKTIKGSLPITFLQFKEGDTTKMIYCSNDPDIYEFEGAK